MALLRGANRPLLTRLVEQEVAVEIGGGPEGGGGGNSPPPPPPTIDFESERVIQCRGELALLDEDEASSLSWTYASLYCTASPLVCRLFTP